MKLWTACLAAAAAALFATPALAAPIECPIPQARREITTQLPRDWWTTPIVNRLTETRIDRIGGEPALVCVYGPAGSVQRSTPRGEICTARRGGFDCVRERGPRGHDHGGPQGGYNQGPIPPHIPHAPVPPPQQHSVYKSGELRVPQTYLVDLDEGVLATDRRADLWLQAETPDRLFLVPRNGATIWMGDTVDRGYLGCAERSAFTDARFALANLRPGTIACVRTNGGHLTQVRIGALEGRASPRTLRLGYTVW